MTTAAKEALRLLKELSEEYERTNDPRIAEKILNLVDGELSGGLHSFAEDEQRRIFNAYKIFLLIPSVKRFALSKSPLKVYWEITKQRNKEGTQKEIERLRTLYSVDATSAAPIKEISKWCHDDFPYSLTSNTRLGFYSHFNSETDTMYVSLGKPDFIPISVFLLMHPSFSPSDKKIEHLLLIGELNQYHSEWSWFLEHNIDHRQTALEHLFKRIESAISPEAFEGIKAKIDDTGLWLLLWRAILAKYPTPDFFALFSPTEYCEYVSADVYQKYHAAFTEFLEDVMNKAVNIFKNAGIEVKDECLIKSEGYMPLQRIMHDASCF